MSARALRLRSTLVGDVLLYPRRSAPAGGASTLPARWVASEVDRWLARLDDRAALYDLLGLRGSALSTESARAHIEWALRSGEVVALRAARPSTVVPLGDDAEDDALGPSSVPPPDDFLHVLLYDPAGGLMPNDLYPTLVAFDVKLFAGPAHVTVDGGVGAIPTIPAGGPSACGLLFTGIADADEDLPPEAPVRAPAVVDPKLARGVVLPTVLRARSAFAQTQPASLDATNVFQLERLRATVVELEHFRDGGAVFLPGLSPAALRDDADRVFGLDALRACLRQANATAADVVVAGHHASLSGVRAKCVAALLTGDRKAWVDLTSSSGGPDDVREILVWLAESRQWDCDPRLGDTPPGQVPAAELRRFKQHYDHQYGGRLPDDGAIDRETWGAFFDLYSWTLRPATEPTRLPHLVVPGDRQTYPVKLAEVSVHDANRWPELNKINPGKAMPGLQGWYPIHVGDVIFLPLDWNLDHLDRAGWTTVRPASGAEPDDPALAILPAARLVVTGCSDRHLVHPQARAPERRAVERHVEVLFTPAPAKACGTSGSCSTRTCELYDPRLYDLDYVVDFVPELTDVTVTVVDSEGQIRPQALVSLLGPTTRHAHTGDDGVAKIGDVQPGRYTVFAHSDGYAIGESTLNVVAAGGGPRLGFLIQGDGDDPGSGGGPPGNGGGPGSPSAGSNPVTIIVAGLSITFVVKGEDPSFRGCPHERPIAGARVVEVPVSPPLAPMTTSYDGLVAVPVSTAGRHTFEFSADGFVTETIEVDVDPALPQPQVVPVPLDAETDEQGMRDRVEAIARAELALWEDSQHTDKDDPNRKAWDRLNDYFTVIPGPQQHITFPSKPAEWCAIFAVWCVRMGAHPCASWVPDQTTGSRQEHVGRMLYTSDPTATLKIGDVVHIKLEWDVQYDIATGMGKDDAAAKEYAKNATGGFQTATTNHHGVVVDIAGSNVTTIEGNTSNPDGNDLPRPKHCAMTLNTTRSTAPARKGHAGYIDYFYSIHP